MTGPLVLYVTGWCRSGTTLIGNLLNEVDGVVHVGELRYLWVNGVLGAGTNSRCGCGLAVLDCPRWRAVLDRVGGADLVATARAWVADQSRLTRTRHTLPRLAEGQAGVRAADSVSAAGDLARRMDDLYTAIGEAFGARVVVDSSKFPAEAALLSTASRLDLRVLHVVRDPRATAQSWLRPKDYIPAMSPTTSTRYWTAFNLASELVCRRTPDASLRLRYEDFTREPRRAVADVLRLVEAAGEPPVDRDGVAWLRGNHTVTGNPDRLLQGAVRIRPDERWRTDLPARPALVATALALPLLARYGYSLGRSPVPSTETPVASEAA